MRTQSVSLCPPAYGFPQAAADAKRASTACRRAVLSTRVSLDAKAGRTALRVSATFNWRSGELQAGRALGCFRKCSSLRRPATAVRHAA